MPKNVVGLPGFGQGTIVDVNRRKSHKSTFFVLHRIILHSLT
jgi:hypothetical protein